MTHGLLTIEKILVLLFLFKLSNRIPPEFRISTQQDNPLETKQQNQKNSRIEAPTDTITVPNT